MRVLLVDNGTRYLAQLRRLLGSHTVDVVPWSSISLSAVGFDLLVLSGGHVLPVMGNEERFASEFDLVRSATVPMLGVCFGFEVIARAYGATLLEMAAAEKGTLTIEPLRPHPIFLGLHVLRVFENHRWVVRDLPDQLMGIAKSRDGIEVIQHRTRPIIGFQFHPELFKDATQGDELFRNALDALMA